MPLIVSQLNSIASVFGVLVSVAANVRTAALASRAGVAPTLHFAFGAATATGLGIAGLATLELVGCYVLFGGDVSAMVSVLPG